MDRIFTTLADVIQNGTILLLHLLLREKEESTLVGIDQMCQGAPYWIN